MSFAVSIGVQDDWTVVDDAASSNVTTAESLNVTGSGSFVSDESVPLPPATATDYVGLFAMLWLSFGCVPLIYKMILRALYLSVHSHRYDMDSKFWGRWAAIEGNILLFAYVAGYLTSVVTILKEVASPGPRFGIALFLAPFYGIVPLYILGKNAHECSLQTGEILEEVEGDDAYELAE
eukprot:SAG22_NODE_9661_length_576_cov_0.958071_1_plen_178_part_01